MANTLHTEHSEQFWLQQNEFPIVKHVYDASAASQKLQTKYGE